MPIIESAGRFVSPPMAGQAHYVEHLRTEDLSVGTYSLPAGADDRQQPHTEDEVYVVTAGRATFVDASGSTPVGPGDTIFVAAGHEHHFIDIREDLAVVVIFAPPEYSRGGPAGKGA